ncbi:MAG: DUF4240 domain-containing protein [Aggregatilineales bacterium]
MERNQFWSIIDSARKSALANNLQIDRVISAMEQNLHHSLIALPPDEIIEFDAILIDLLEETYDNWLRGVYIVTSSWSNPARFDNFRAYMIMMGKGFMKDIQTSHEILLHGLDPFGADFIGEMLRTTGEKAYFEKTETTMENSANDYSRSGKPIGKPLTSEYLKQLREKWHEIHNVQLDRYSQHPFLNLPLEPELVARLKDVAYLSDINLILHQLLDIYEIGLGEQETLL